MCTSTAPQSPATHASASVQQDLDYDSPTEEDTFHLFEFFAAAHTVPNGHGEEGDTFRKASTTFGQSFHFSRALLR